MATVCTNCGFNNPPGMRFCGNCGTRLPEAASLPPKTSAPVDPGQLGVMTGADLLDRFREAGLEASGQRRSVTVLFVDLSGFTALSEQLGDEELYDLVQKFIRLLVNDVYKYEGMVDKLTGDGLMALFGAPIAHENNAERALRSALDMQQDVTRLSQELDLHGYQLRIHVGLNAGTVIVGGLGGDGLMNYTAIGDSVNLARRLEEAAEPGTVLVSESVYHQTERLFDYTQLPPLSLKNISREVTAFRVVGPKDRPRSVRGVDGLHAPMIGRESEFNQVQAMVNRLVSDRQGGVVFLVGEGGMGKSRLTSELKARLDYTQVRVLEGFSLTYRKSIAYWIFQDMLRTYLGISQEATDEEVRARLAENISAMLGDEGRDRLAYIEHILSLEPSNPQDAERIRYLDAGQLQQQIFLAVRDLLLAEAKQKPLLLILEDLHWADDASLDLIRFLLDSTRGAPLLIYAISRPFEGGAVQAIHERAGQRLGERYVYIRLQALPPDQSAQLLHALLAIQDLPERLRKQIIDRSAGLPFYLEEILRMLIEDRVIYQQGEHWHLSADADLTSVGVPETLQGLILTRFDRLMPNQRHVLQTATVVGYQFSGQVLYSVLQMMEPPAEALDEIEIRAAMELLVEREYIVPQTGGTDQSFMFKHVLVSDAVYSTLLQRDRRDLHTRAGRAIEQIYAGRLETQTEVLASHFLRSSLLDRALYYLTLAGQKAARSYVNEQAKLFFSQALELLPKVEHTSDQAVQVYQGLGDALLTAGEYPAARDQYQRGLEVLGARAGTTTLADPGLLSPEHWAERKRLLSLLQRKIGRTHEGLGDYDRALACLQAAQSVLDGNNTGYQAERANILSDIGWIDFRRGNLDQSETVLLEALPLAEEAGQLDVVASVLNRLAAIYWQRDILEQAARYLMRSLVLREQIGDVVAVARSYNNLGLLGWKQGDLIGALDNFNHSYKLQANLGDVEGLIVLNTNMGLIALDRGNLENAKQHFQDALESAGEIGHFFHVCMARMHLTLLNVYAENWGKVLEHGQLGLVGFQELGVQDNQVDLYVMMGWAYRGLGDQQRLDATLQRVTELLAEETSRAVGPTEGEGRAQRLFGWIARDRNDLSGARQALEKSVLIFKQIGNRIEQSRVLVDLAGVLKASGENEPAVQLLSEARSTFEQIGASLELERLQQVEKIL
jgi:class 3 adenylate cyclase/tetratricopeptide (TPR) repeat protein